MRLSADSLAEMWSFVFRRNRLSSDEATAERLLARQSLGRGAPASQRTLELVLAAAAGPATERELTGETTAVNAFLGALPEPGMARRRSPRRVPVLAAGFMIVALVAVAATAEAGALPAPLQQLAHQAINAPAPPPALRAPQPGADLTPGPGARGTHPAPAGSGLNQQTHAGKPSATPKPTHTSASPSDGSGQPSGSPSASPSAGDNGQGNGGTPGHGGTPSAHPTGNGPG